MNYYNLSDQAVVDALGKSLKAHRLRQNLTQDQLSARAGVDRTTISYLENGRPSSLLTLIQVLRGLELLDVLQEMEVREQSSPLELLKQEGKRRKRASGKSKGDKPSDSEW